MQSSSCLIAEVDPAIDGDYFEYLKLIWSYLGLELDVLAQGNEAEIFLPVGDCLKDDWKSGKVESVDNDDNWFLKQSLGKLYYFSHYFSRTFIQFLSCRHLSEGKGLKISIQSVYVNPYFFDIFVLTDVFIRFQFTLFDMRLFWFVFP